MRIVISTRFLTAACAVAAVGCTGHVTGGAEGDDVPMVDAGQRPDGPPPADAAGGDARSPADAQPDAPPDAVPVDAAPVPVTMVDPDVTGTAATLFTTGAPDPSGPFFTSLGTNGRSCATCHDRTAGWSVTPAGLQARFDATGGTDPAFRPSDGAVSPNADVSTVAARRTAYALLLSRGVIRVGLPMPKNAEFTLAAVSDPYGFASAAELSLFRRILPATNLAFAATVMWDGREPDLAHQAMDATLGHAQAGSADPDTMTAIVAFERSLYTAQEADATAGALGSDAGGGVAALSAQPYYYGVNDSQGRDPMAGTPYTPDVFTAFAGWANLTGTDPQTLRRLSIARGEAIFNRRAFKLAGIPGMPDNPKATCSTCHDTPGTGGHSLDEMIRLGIDIPRSGGTQVLPVYTLQRTSDGTTTQTTDPGLALVTGKWDDIGKFRVPTLRGLALRAPYFHNGFSASLTDLVSFYDNKFSIGLTAQDKADLAAFLGAL